MANVILACDYGAIRKACRDVVCKVTHDRGKDGGSRFIDPTDYGQKVNCCFEGTREKPGAGQEEVTNGG